MQLVLKLAIDRVTLAIDALIVDAHLALGDDEHRRAGVSLAEDVRAALELDLLERDRPGPLASAHTL